jgi:hypothetical protein
MAKARKSKTSKRDRYGGFGDLSDEAEEDADLPKDEAGRRKIKRQYADLLGIRIEKLRGRILNRERINKTIEGIYFICASCMKVCHSLDDGLQEDPANQQNLCGACAKAKAHAEAAAARESGGSTRSTRRKRAAAS